ncbi:MAG TPA: enoyl-CoA hydratase-related protein [Actinomycetota bacterium]
MSEPGITFDVAERVATVTLDRQERRNAMSLATLDALADAWRRFDADEDVRAVILTGAGDVAFSAGADLKEFAPADQRHRVGPTHDAFFPERVLLKPLIAAVNGLCLAGGFELLLACDVRLAADHATFGLPEPALGLFPGGGSAVRAPRRLGWANAMDLILTGEPVDAATALRMGLVSRVVPREDLMPTARAVAARLARNSPGALRAIKRCALETDGMTLAEAFERQTDFSRAVIAGPGPAKGIAAFREKRAPRF